MFETRREQMSDSCGKLEKAKIELLPWRKVNKR